MKVPKIEAIATRLDVAPAAVARVIIAAHTNPPSGDAQRASGPPQPHLAAGAAFLSPQVLPLGPTDGRASSPASGGSTAGILEELANDLIDDVLDDDGGFDVFEGATKQ